ncbi:hypothetical protein Q3A66_19140 [Hymenobacter sp. BT770]|uniref:hypothetical protein n=1 Tax=Hymenobacter sp. BT770 TaxID=2886942 RepID=UPI001D122590|nr:hypothetical protein [Hymenobacter sp. BT770]MCC3155234.1 hypothetical protein [Hymenobacter sp. BT770]MDO3417189.1 hypothetical protein [Hymenobacter sp. BT770]
MKNLAVRGRMFVAFTVLSLSGSTLLTGCFEKEESATPDNSVCNTAATVVKNAAGALTLQLADGTILTPSGTSWTSFNATAGQKLTIGYYTKKGDCGSAKTTSPTAEIGCITAVADTTTSAN